MKIHNSNLREEMNSQIANLREHTDVQIASLKESIDQLNAQLLANSEMHHADMDRLTQKIDANTQDLRTEISKLNHSHISHLEHHIELAQRAEEK
jgi:phage host-nuclease inhibitor protein Gam